VEQTKHVIGPFEVGLRVQPDYPVLLLELRALVLGVTFLAEQVVARKALEQGLAFLTLLALPKRTLNRFLLTGNKPALLTHVSDLV
jgi:hypothetical protein